MGGGPFRRRVMVTYKSEPVRERRTFPARSVVVPMAQAAARAALHLLEPEVLIRSSPGDFSTRFLNRRNTAKITCSKSWRGNAGER